MSFDGVNGFMDDDVDDVLWCSSAHVDVEISMLESFSSAAAAAFSAMVIIRWWVVVVVLVVVLLVDIDGGGRRIKK